MDRQDTCLFFVGGTGVTGWLMAAINNSGSTSRIFSISPRCDILRRYFIKPNNTFCGLTASALNGQPAWLTGFGFDFCKRFRHEIAIAVHVGLRETMVNECLHRKWSHLIFPSCRRWTTSAPIKQTLLAACNRPRVWLDLAYFGSDFTQ